MAESAGRRTMILRVGQRRRFSIHFAMRCWRPLYTFKYPFSTKYCVIILTLSSTLVLSASI